MRKFILDKESEVPLGRITGFYEFSKKYLGISTRVWQSFLNKQRQIRASDPRVPQTKNKGGKPVKQVGHLELDLIETFGSGKIMITNQLICWLRTLPEATAPPGSLPPFVEILLWELS